MNIKTVVGNPESIGYISIGTGRADQVAAVGRNGGYCC